MTERRGGWKLPRGLDRPIVGVVGLDPARVGDAGLCVMPVDGAGRARLGAPFVWRQGQVFNEGAMRWLGDAAARLCRPGQRLVLVAESDAFGPSIARKLGMCVGGVELHLMMLHAIEPESRIDVSQSTWRRAVLLNPRAGGSSSCKRAKLPTGRDKLKAIAVMEARARTGQELPIDAAEAWCIATWGVERMGSDDGTNTR